MPMTTKQALQHYDLPPVSSLKRLTSGLIHNSYRVNTAKGVFLLQQLHPKLADPGTTADYFAVTEHLTKQGLYTQRLIADRRGRIHLKDGQRAWRIMTFIPGHTLAHLSTASQVEKLGSALGKFHAALSTFTAYKFKAKLRLHQTEKIYTALCRTIARFAGHPLYKEAAKEGIFLKQTLPALFLPKNLPLRIIHGDPKFTNFIFGPEDTVSLVDLDTCARHTILVDLGDALRSWWSPKDESPHFRLEYFSAALQGYYSAAPRFLTKVEQRYIIQAIKLITLELSARFFIDYFEDHYFGWDPKKFSSRRDHNLARLQGQLRLYQEILRHENELWHIQKTVFRS